MIDFGKLTALRADAQNLLNDIGACERVITRIFEKESASFKLYLDQQNQLELNLENVRRGLGNYRSNFQNAVSMMPSGSVKDPFRRLDVPLAL